MEEKNKIIIGNITTIITTISLSAAGLIIGILTSYGLHLNIDETSLAGVICTILMFCFSIINAKYKSTYFTDTDDTLTINTSDLTTEQVKSIQNFIDNAIVVNKHHNSNIDGEISDIDPSLEYEVKTGDLE